MLHLLKSIYFDNNATTKVTSKVRRRINTVLKKRYANPSSFYTNAQHSGLILEKARKTIANVINANENEIIFTGSASEANNQILKTLSEHNFPNRKIILTSPIEHASVKSTLEYLETKGLIVKQIPILKSGQIDLDALKDLISPDVFLICVMFANNEIGSVQNITAISKIAKENGILLFSDCVQALGKIPVDIQTLGVDYASFSAHKIHGPKGCGALYVKDGSPIHPFIHGGHQEKGLRAGTEGHHNIAGFAAAMLAVPALLKKASLIKEKRDFFAAEIKKLHPNILFNSPAINCLPNTLNVSFTGVDNAELMAIFDLHGIEVSAGSACNTGENKPSHVLKAIGLSDLEAQSSIRFSLSEKSTYGEIAYVVKVLKKYYQGKFPRLNVIKPDDITENLFSDPNLAIIDIRFWNDRKLLKTLSGGYESSVFAYKKCAKLFPKTKKILIVCQTGKLSPMLAYKLYQTGYHNVAYLMTGMLGLSLTRPDLYRNNSGKNIKRV